jgi:hypothetical protein
MHYLEAQFHDSVDELHRPSLISLRQHLLQLVGRGGARVQPPDIHDVDRSRVVNLLAAELDK